MASKAGNAKSGGKKSAESGRNKVASEGIGVLLIAGGILAAAYLFFSATGYLGEVLGKALAPKRIHRVPVLPKTRNGKILRRLVRAAYLDQPLGDLSSLEDASAIEAIRSCRSAS